MHNGYRRGAYIPICDAGGASRYSEGQRSMASQAAATGERCLLLFGRVLDLIDVETWTSDGHD